MLFFLEGGVVWNLPYYGGGGGGYKKGRNGVGASKSFTSTKRRGGGGRKSYSHAEGGHTNFRGSFYVVA